MSATMHKIEFPRPATGFAAQLTQELKPLQDRVYNNLVVERIHSGKASKKLIYGLGKEFLPIVRGTYRRMSLRLQHVPPHEYEVQAALLKEVSEEVWHTPMYYRWAKAVGMKLPQDFAGPYLPETYAFVLLLTCSSSDRGLLEESTGRIIDEEHFDDEVKFSQLGAMVQTVAISGLALPGFPLASDKLAEGFVKHYGLNREEAEFWYEHGTLDADHARMGYDIIDCYATTPYLQRRAREAAWLSVEFWVRQWDAIGKKYGD